MYYRLNENYLLRGWQKLPWALVDTETGSTRFLSRKEFEVLDLANGLINFELPVITQQQRHLAEKFAEENIVIRCEKPGAIRKEQEYIKFDNRFIHRIQWSITGRCNYRCRHCFVSAPHYNQSEPSFETLSQAIDQMAQAGIFQVALTGGEPLIRPDFLLLLDALQAHHIQLSQIYTNGALVNETLLDELDKRKMKPQFCLSFDGVGTHDWLRGIQGAEQAAKRAFLLCRERGFPALASYCLHQNNKEAVYESIEQLEKWGVRSLKITPIENLGEWQKGNYHLDLSFEEEMKFYLEIIDFYFQKRPNLSLQLGEIIYLDPADNNRCRIPAMKQTKDPAVKNLCDVTRNMMYLSSQGDVLPCFAMAGTKAEKSFGNLFETPLTRLLSDSSYLDFITMKGSDFFSVNDECASCKDRISCLGGCRAKALISSGNLLFKDPYTCRLYKEGWIDQIKEKLESLQNTCH